MIVAGVISMTFIGDALQCCITTKMVSREIPLSDITFICSDSQELAASELLHPSIRLVNSYGTLILKQLLGSNIFNRLANGQQKNVTHKTANKEVTFRTSLAKTLVNNCYSSWKFNRYVTSPVCRTFFSFDAGILSGHTITGDFSSFNIQYNYLRSVVPRGPVVTSPISLSRLSLEYCQNKDRYKLKNLRKSLEELDFIFVRGPYSQRILKEEFNISDKVAIALDNGFGLRSFYPDARLTGLLKKRALKIIIFPRKEFFEFYNKMELYKPYLESLVGLIEWLIKRYDAEIHLALQVTDNHVGRRLSGIDDVLTLFEKRSLESNQFLKHLQIFQPSNVLDAFQFYSSADVIVSSYMHGGIMALSAGVPSIFIAPLNDIKILDILATLGLNSDSFLIDMFDNQVLTATNFIEKTSNVIENLESYRDTIKNTVDRLLPSIDLPAKKLAVLVK